MGDPHPAVGRVRGTSVGKAPMVPRRRWMPESAAPACAATSATAKSL
ncbi:hypothetical protein ACWGI9_05760 [Streptomyces sp. NPDC054833]